MAVNMESLLLSAESRGNRHVPAGTSLLAHLGLTHEGRFVLEPPPTSPVIDRLTS